MKKALGLVMVLMLLSWSVATVHPVIAAASTNETETTAYDAFWEILNREAELYAQVAKGNESAIPELINNSRLGAENAVNISTLIWEGIGELKASGVKTYYTADELRAMAENISKNGLPNETVQELKAQGWTDEQIKALEDYIAKNADNITEDFNMTAFFQNFSTAFMKVAFKYNHYEVLGLKRLLNLNSSSLDVPMVIIVEGPTLKEVPLAWEAFLNFNSSYATANTAEKLALLRELEESVLNMSRDTGWRTLRSTRQILTDKTSCPIVSNPTLLGKTFKNASLVSHRLVNGSFVIPISPLPSGAVGYYFEGVSVRSFVSGQYVIVEVLRKWSSQKVLDDCSIQTESGEEYTIYYWKAFDALEALRNLEVTLEAIQKGNGNPDLRELEANLTRSLPELFKTGKVGYYWMSSTALAHYAPKKSKPIPGDPQPPAVEGISSSDASLDVGVEVSAADVTEDYATYKVTVAIQAKGGSVSDVDINVNGDGLSDSKHYNVISEDDGVLRWTTRASSKIYGSGSVNVSGTVDVYYSIPHATPMSIGLPKDDETTGSNDRNHIKKHYSGTIRLGTPIKPGKVTFKIIPSDDMVKPDSDVTFRVQVINNNDRPIGAEYTLNVTYSGGEVPANASFSNFDVVQKGDPWTDTAGTVHYASTGTFHYSGVLKFDGFSKTAEGDVVVSLYANESGSDPSPSNGSLRIVSVTPNPTSPKEGDTVSFDVKIDSSYQDTKRAIVKLYVDGELKDSKEVEVGTSGASVTLHWNAQAGEHSYTVKVYRLVDGQELWEDSKGRDINVTQDRIEIVKTECPERIGLGETVTCKIYLKNNLAERININTKDVFLYGHPYDEYLQQSKTVKIEYPIQNSINIDPNQTEVLLVAPIHIPEKKSMLDYRYIYDSALGGWEFAWIETNYTLEIQLDMPYPQNDTKLLIPIKLYYFGSKLMQENSSTLANELLGSVVASGIGAGVALFLGLSPVGGAIVTGIVVFMVAYAQIEARG